MAITKDTKYILATVGLLLLGVAYSVYAYQDVILTSIFPHSSKEVHVHADLLVAIFDQKIDLTDSRYQSSSESIKHPSMHFHDNIDTVLHRHAEGITLGSFFESIGISLTSDCIALDTEASLCTNEDTELALYVNGGTVEDISEYVIQEEDQILLYYGERRAAEVAAFNAVISDDSCLYSGTCPERGDPPAESCGLTCEL